MRYQRISTENRDFAPKFDPKSPNRSSLQKARINVLSYGIKIATDFFPFCHNPHVCQIDGHNSNRETAAAFHAAQ